MFMVWLEGELCHWVMCLVVLTHQKEVLQPFQGDWKPYLSQVNVWCFIKIMEFTVTKDMQYLLKIHGNPYYNKLIILLLLFFSYHNTALVSFLKGLKLRVLVYIDTSSRVVFSWSLLINKPLSNSSQSVSNFLVPREKTCMSPRSKAYT